MKQTITRVGRRLADGETGYHISAADADGREYVLLNHETGAFREFSFYRSIAIANKIKAAGVIDLNFWACRTPYGTRAWLLDGMEQREIEDEMFGYA